MNPFIKAYSDLYSYGHIANPRGQKIIELEDYQIKFDPINDRFTNFKPRKMNLSYAKKEFAWYLRGNRYEMSITDEAQMWKDIVDVDGGINSNYGQYIFHDQHQYHWVVTELIRDIDSRRAVMTLLNHTHLRANNPDVVCTYAIGFRIRQNKLNMSIHMRSWDAIWGMTNDVFCFSCIYEVIYSLLKRYYPTLEVGRYVHTADSIHIYERHFKMLDQLITEINSDPIYCPRIYNSDEANYLINHRAPVLAQDIPDNYLFSKWLFEV